MSTTYPNPTSRMEEAPRKRRLSPRSAGDLAWIWFPVALIILLILGLPGQILLACHLAGWDTKVNKWLQNTFHLSYQVGVPTWASILLLLLPFLILLLYFLKLKRKPLQVPSTFLWRKSIEDLHVNSLFQWLRENVLLLLQLLIVLILTYGVMNFQFHAATGDVKHYIILIDNSASMSATDVSPSRLKVAKQEALREIDSRSDSDVGMVIVFNSSAQTLRSRTSDRGLLRRAVESIQPTQRTTRIDEALAYADGLANPHRSTEEGQVTPDNVEPGKERTYVPAEGIPTEVHLYSDGRFPDVPEFALGNLNVHYHPIGNLETPNVDNVGLVTLNAVRVEGDEGKLQVFARVLNFRRHRVISKVQLDVFVNNERVGGYVKQLELEPMQAKAEKDSGKAEPALRDLPGEGSVTFEVRDLDNRANAVLHAKLENYRAGAGGQIGEPFRDEFPLDDEGWLVAGIVRKARVLVIGKRNKALHDFFDQKAIEKVAAVTYVTPDQFLDEDGDFDDKQYEENYRKPARDGAYDLIIFDRWSPEKEDDMPLANTFFIHAVPPPWKKADMPKLENPHIKGWMTKHPLLRGLVGLHDIGISDAFRFELDPKLNPRVPPRTPRLLETDRGAAVMFTLSRHSFTDLVMTFPLVNDAGKWSTDWPKELSFLLFLYNLLYHFGNISDAASEETVQPGQIKTIRPDVPGKDLKIEVTDPRGQTDKLERGSRADIAYGKTDTVGVYTVKWGGNVQRSFAVNLLDAEESNIKPRSEIHIGAKAIGAGVTRDQPRQTWWWVALGALVFLLLEWFLYNRRVYI